MLHPLISYIRKCNITQNIEEKEILGFFKERTYNKKSLLLREGEICHFEGFILEGCVKTYFIDQKGSEVILTLSSENWWISDLLSFQERIPSHFNIETIEKTRLLIIDHTGKDALLKAFPSLERMFRLMVQRHLSTFQQRVYENLALSAEERYTLFIEKHPELLQRVPQYLVASYLGITAEFLSRLRKRKMD